MGFANKTSDKFFFEQKNSNKPHLEHLEKKDGDQIIGTGLLKVSQKDLNETNIHALSSSFQEIIYIYSKLLTKKSFIMISDYFNLLLS